MVSHLSRMDLLVPEDVYLSRMFGLIQVYADGGICLDILQNRWSPTYDVSAILTSIQVTIGFFYLHSFVRSFVRWLPWQPPAYSIT